MKKTICAMALCGLVLPGAWADDVSQPRASYIATSVLTAAGVDLSGQDFPGAGIASWIDMPADAVVFLKGDWVALLDEVKTLGDVSVLTGNEAVMHLSTGNFERFKGSDGGGLVTSKGIDLRLFMSRWAYGAAILPASGSVPGFIFFNSAGTPVHRILLTESSHSDAFDVILARYKGETPKLSLSPVARETVESPSEETRAALLNGWRKMQDTHEFSGLLRAHKISRMDALHAAEGEFTAQLDPASYGTLFEQLVDGEVSIMFFALNDGCVQISTGVINEINRTRGTLQLVEDDSRTLISLSQVKQAWRVSKPTERGLIHSLELYDETGEPVAYLFGSEKGDSTSIVKWKELLYALPLANEGAVKVAGETNAGNPAL